MQMAVLGCIAAAVRECVVSQKETSESPPHRSTSPSSHVHGLLLQAGLPIPVHTRPSLSVLSTKLSTLFSLTLTPHTQLPLDTRRTTLEVWKAILGVMQGGCDPYLSTLIPTLTLDASHSDVRLRTDALLLLRLTFELHPHTLTSPYLEAVSSVCVQSMDVSYLKTKAEALRLTSTLLSLHPSPPLITRLYSAIKGQLRLTDVDAEVKEAALSSMALLLALHHEVLSPAEVEGTLPVFHSRLGNEVTRLSALRAITRLTASPSLPLRPILSPTLSDLLVFLRKDNAVLRQETMLTLLALARTQAGEDMKGEWTTVVKEVEGYIDDRDVYVSTLGMDTIRAVLPYQGKWVGGDEGLIERLMALLESPLLQGGVLGSLTALFKALVVGGGEGGRYEALVDRLSRVSEKATPSTLMATAQCISAITAHATPAQRKKTVLSSLGSLTGGATPPTPPNNSRCTCWEA